MKYLYSVLQILRVVINYNLSNRTRININEKINEIINEKINEIINVQLMIINVQNKARSAPKLKR